jgi:glycosyltransferase involved in cell wall biosynthesis
MTVKLFISGDLGPSGFGVATRGMLWQLLDDPEIDLCVRTHHYGLSQNIGHMRLPNKMMDARLREKLLRDDRVNEAYLSNDPRDIPRRDSVGALEAAGTATSLDDADYIIRDFEGDEDVWLLCGEVANTDEAPDHAYSILHCDWNLDKMPRDWEYFLSDVDEIWVPSAWTKQSIVERMPDRADDIIVLPYGVDTQYRPTAYDHAACPAAHDPARADVEPCVGDDTFTFLMVSRFYHIKGIYRAIKAYVEEFRSTEDVRLMFKTTSNNHFEFDAQASINHVVRNELGYPDPPEIGIEREPLTTQKMYDLFGEADAFIQASRAECFGIAQVQAAYCGTPVIYTNWSSQREIFPDDHEAFFPLDDYEVEAPEQESQAFVFDRTNQYPPDSNWAVPSIDELRDTMRSLFEDGRERCDERGEAATDWAIKNYSWEVRGPACVDRIKEVTP